MLVATDLTGKKRVPYLESIDALRILSDEHCLKCPECETLVTLIAGERRSHHFRHHRKGECAYESEPETEEHRHGKLLIYDWLSIEYPTAMIELEYKVKDTGQRADVMALFPNGDRWAFEIQCSPITGEAWKERNALYEQAGIKNYWILGKSVHKYGFTNREPDQMKHKLIDLALTVYQKQKWLLFLDTKSEKLTCFYWFKDDSWHSRTTLYTVESNFLLSELKNYENFWSNREIHDQYLSWRRARRNKAKKIWNERRLTKEARKRKEEEELQRRNQKLKDALAYQLELREFKIEKIKKNMTRREVLLFENLISKHQLNDRNFPGICKVYVPFMEFLQTPYPLWQLWLYDQYIYPFKRGKKKFWVPDAVKSMGKIFRIVKGDIDVHFSFAVYKYFETLSETGMLVQLSKRNSKYYEILSNELPQANSLKIQSYIAYRLSMYSGILTKNKKNISEEINHAWTDYIKNFQGLKTSVALCIPSKVGAIHPSFQEYNQLQYMMNLFQANPEILTELEGAFLLDFKDTVNKKVAIDFTQAEQYSWIKRKIEKFYEISLDLYK